MKYVGRLGYIRRSGGTPLLWTAQGLQEESLAPAIQCAVDGGWESTEQKLCFSHGRA